MRNQVAFREWDYDAVSAAIQKSVVTVCRTRHYCREATATPE